MITRFHVQNYKALRDVSLELTPIHVLIGPNDSGKSSILEAMTALGRMMLGQSIANAFEGSWTGGQLVWRGQPDAAVTLDVDLELNDQRWNYAISFKFDERAKNAHKFSETIAKVDRHTRQLSEQTAVPKGGDVAGIYRISESPGSQLHLIAKSIRHELCEAQLYRWIPAHLALPVVFGSSPLLKMEPTGFGLAILLDDLWREDRKKYTTLEEQFQSIFPEIERIVLRRELGFLHSKEASPGQPGVRIYFALCNARGEIPASQASDGILLVLAYLALLYSPKGPRLLLLEEPENGIHPARVGEVLRILRELSQERHRTQILLTTHSPYAVDLFKPEEVTLCRKGADGAVTTLRLSESKSVREQIDIFKLGEIWTAEGDEALAMQPAAK